MWRHIELENYRSIERLAFDVAPFSVVVGANAAGKSNFADAFVFARDIGTDASSAMEKRGGIVGVRRWSRTKPCDVLVDVRTARSKESLLTDYVRHMFKIHSGNEGKWSFSKELIEIVQKGTRTLQVSRKGNEVSCSSKEITIPKSIPINTSVMFFAKQAGLIRKWTSLSRVRRFQLDPSLMRHPQVATENPRLEESGSNITTVLRRNPTLLESVLPIMKRIVPGLHDVSVEPLGRYLSLKFEQNQRGADVADFSGTEMSEGALRALGIAVASHQMLRDELLIIEEPGVSIHAGAATLLFEVLKSASLKGSVLVTTHSADLLDAARDEEILVCQYLDGITQVGPLATSQRNLVREGLFSLAEIMRAEPLRIEGEEVRALDPARLK
jgi:type I restriction enzyme M protein